MGEFVLQQMSDVEAITDCLIHKGLSKSAAARQASQLSRAAAALIGEGLPVDHPVTAAFVPGRIEVFGKHTDYAGGQSIVCAVERGFAFVAAPLGVPRLHVTAIDHDESVSFDLAPEITPRPRHWSRYPMTVARRVAMNFPGANRGARIAFTSDLPPAAGLSSSSALIVGVFTLLDGVNDLRSTPEYRRNVTSDTDLAEYLGTIENGQTYRELPGDRGVGTFGGSEDHTAIICAQPGALQCFAYAPTRHVETIALNDEFSFVIAASGLTAEKIGAARAPYNSLAERAAAACRAWCEATGRQYRHLGAALDSPEFDPGLMAAMLQSHDDDLELLHRYEHFYIENCQCIPAARAAFRSGDAAALGEAAAASQDAAERLLGNQVEETSALVRIAREVGAMAASAFGAGFGGSVWALVERDDATQFRNRWEDQYAREFPQHQGDAMFFVTGVGPGAVRLP